MADPPVKSASIQSSGVGFGGILADPAPMGVPAFRGMGMTSDSTDGGSGGRDARLGRILPIVGVLAGRGGRVKRWMMGARRSSGRPTGWASDLVRLLRGGGSCNREQSLRSEQQWHGWRSCIQYIRFPIVRDGGLDGQALVRHGRVADEYDVVLSPSDRGQQIGEITIAGDKDDCGWGWIVVDKRHNIH